MARRRTLRDDTRGLSTIEYVILLIVVACVGIAGWKMFGRTSSTRASQASGAVVGLGETPGRRAGGGAVASSGGGSGSRLEEATGEIADPAADDGLGLSPALYLGAAAVLVIGVVGVRFLRRGRSGDGGGKKKG